MFFQHPDLIRLLGIHETVMQLMVNTLNKAQQESAATETAMSAIDSQKRSSSLSQLPTEAAPAEPPKVQYITVLLGASRILIQGVDHVPPCVPNANLRPSVRCRNNVILPIFTQKSP